MTVLLSTHALSRRFGGLAALQDVSLELAAGARHAVIGPNGAGKTTLLGVIAGTIRPTSGQVSFAGRDITGLGPARRSRRGIARTFQTPAVCPSLSAVENLTLAAWPHHWPTSRRGRRETTRSVRRQLDMLGLVDAGAVPAGRLSHGQRRMLEIGMALVARPRLVLLDEPAAGLTDRDLLLLLDRLRRLPDEVSILLVEHHMDLVSAVAEAVTVLHQGRVLAQGTPAQIRTHPAVAEVYLGTTGARPAVT